MTSTPVSEIGDKYVLPTGTDDAARLDVIHAVYGPVSIKGLEAAAVSTAARVADIGCGTGTVSRWMAARMGASGRVDAIDIAPEQIEVAKAAPVNAGSAAIHYQVGSAYEPGLPENAFDVVFCRLVLCHLKEPQKAVVQMAKLLKPGGRLVLVEYRGEDPDVPIKPLHKMTEAQVRREFSVHPVRFERNVNVLPRQHILIFRRPMGSGR